uniref:Uncharacterized protein n=1 Tax=Rhizophora mucronata TaxID=61149 RepID=A0A2P2QZJ2_RHIMU
MLSAKEYKSDLPLSLLLGSN